MSQEEPSNVPINQETGIMKIKSTADVREILQTYTREKQYTSLLYKSDPLQHNLPKPNAVSPTNVKRPLDTPLEKKEMEGVKWMKCQSKNLTVIEQKTSINEANPSEQAPAEDITTATSMEEEKNIEDENVTQDVSNDSYCWICHKEGNVLCCEVCPRVFHLRCLGEREEPPGDWVCPECQAIEKAENVDTRSPAMAMLNMEELCRLLKFTIHKMKQHAPEAFLRPVCTKQFPSYPHYVFHPMDLSTLEKNIQLKMYGCTESFLADVKWILHNCIIFNGYQHQLTNNAKTLVKLGKYEMEEIETCPDCYLHACMHKEHWFCEPCRKPHIVVWAKLKGFPFWPAKVMRIIDGNIDVRFFGAHDRAWVPVNQCYLLSKEMPTPMKCKKKGSFELSLEEITIYANRVKEVFGSFQYAPVRTPFDPENPPLYSTLSLPKLPEWSYSPCSSTVASPQPTVTNIPTVTSPAPKKMKHKERRYCKTEDIRKKEVTRYSAATTSSSLSSWEGRMKSEPPSPRQQLPPKTSSVRKRAPPIGIFEVSDESTIKMPALLEINIPKLSLNKSIKTSGKIVEKLESKIQQITEGSSGNSDDEVNKDSLEAPHLSPQREQIAYSNDSVFSNDDSTKYRLSPLSESMQSSAVNTLSESDSDDLPLSELCQSNAKKEDVFSQKLNRIIESCKAKLGIKEVQIDDIEAVESDEDYIQPINEEDSSGESTLEVNSEDKHSEENCSNTSRSHENATDADSSKLKSNSMNSKESKSESQRCDDTDNSDSWLSDDSQPLAVIIKKAKMTKPSEETQPASEEPQKVPDTQLEDTSSESLEHLLETAAHPLSSKEVNMINANGDNSVESSENACADNADHKHIENHITLESGSPHDHESSVSQFHDDIATPEADTVSDEDSNMVTSDAQKCSSKVLNEVYDNQEETASTTRDVESLKLTIKNLQLEIEKLQWYHQQELIEMKHNSDLVLLEMRASLESDKQRTIRELQQQHKIEMQKAIEETKKKQWVKEEASQLVSAPTAKVIPSQQLGPILQHSGSQSKSLLLQPQHLPQVQYIPSNAVQILPQTTPILGNTGQSVQIQYITSLSSLPRNQQPPSIINVGSASITLTSQSTPSTTSAGSKQGSGEA